MARTIVTDFGRVQFSTVPHSNLLGVELVGNLFVLSRILSVFFFLMWFYRWTGKVFLGVLMIASLAMW